MGNEIQNGEVNAEDMEMVLNVGKNYLTVGETELPGYILFHGISKGCMVMLMSFKPDIMMDNTIALEHFQVNNYNVVSEPESHLFKGNILKFGANTEEYTPEIEEYVRWIQDDQEIDINDERFPEWYRLPLLVHGPTFVEFLTHLKEGYAHTKATRSEHENELRVLMEIIEDLEKELQEPEEN